MHINHQRVCTAMTILFLSLLLFGTTALAQSGRGLMHGYVAFEDLSYNEVESGAIHATVELRTAKAGGRGAYTTQTNEHGAYDFPSIAMGEYVLHITAPGYSPYEAELYIPSDFECKLAVMLKKENKRAIEGKRR